MDKKVKKSLEELQYICTTLADYKKYFELEKYANYLSKHIDLTQRRLIDKETIPHHEKMFSVFETYTELINKGKQNHSFELGKTFYNNHQRVLTYSRLRNNEQNNCL